jgi:hypothetical protein
VLFDGLTLSRLRIIRISFSNVTTLDGDAIKCAFDRLYAPMLEDVVITPKCALQADSAEYSRSLCRVLSSARLRRDLLVERRLFRRDRIHDIT